MKLEIHLQKEKWKNKHWRLKKYANKILMGHCKKKKEEIIKYFEKNEKHTHTHTHKFPKSIQDAAKADQRGKFIVI